MRLYVVLPQKAWLDSLRRTVAQLVSVALNVRRLAERAAQPQPFYEFCDRNHSTYGVQGGKNGNVRRKGFSIVEVAMASTLLIVAMIPVLKNLTRAHQLSIDIERKTCSLILAQGKLDERKARSVYNFGSTGSLAQTDLSLGNSYLCNVDDESTANPDLRTVTVSVGHDGNGNGTLSADEVEVTLATYIARRWPDY